MSNSILEKSPMINKKIYYDENSNVESILDEFRSIQKYFEEQVLQSPDKIALISNDDCLTFRELNLRANIFAQELKKNSNTEDTIVAIFLPRSINAIITVLACVKAGFAYLPIDKGYPKSFIEFIIEDANPELIITDSEIKFKSSINNIRIDKFIFKNQNYYDESPSYPEEKLAWILYTSGSTGKPKGVRGLHRGIVQRCLNLWNLQPYLENEIAIQNTALTVVDSHWEIWGPLSKGIPLVLLEDEVNKNPYELINLLDKFNVTRICLVPSLLQAIINSVDELNKKIPKLKLWIVSGELLAKDLVKSFYRALPDAILINQYGLTETSADITSYDTSQTETNIDETEIIPIGKPFPGTNIYILDEDLVPVPDGEQGQLYISGVAVVDGYLNRPEFSRERFLDNPFSNSYNKLLATGDMGYKNKNGNIIVCGRIDRQVKVRGYRVELDNIENIILKYKKVSAVAIVCTINDNGNTILNAYVQPKKELITIENIREYCINNLPQYMIPHKVFIVDEMPRTGSGKIDRKALLSKEIIVIDVMERNDLTETENKVRHIWCKILDLPDVRVVDLFFDIGGDSLTFIAMVNTIQKEFNCNLPVKDVLKKPNIGNIANIIDKGNSKILKKNFISEYYDYEKGMKDNFDNKSELSLSVTQSAIYLHNKVICDGNPYGITYSVILDGKFNIDVFDKSIKYIIKNNPVLCSRIFMTEDGPKQRIDENIIPNIDIIRARNTVIDFKDEYIRNQIDLVSNMRLNLEQSPPYYIRIVKLSDEENLLIIQFHHLVFDGLAVKNFMNQLSKAYTIYLEGGKLPLVERDYRFLKYCIWENQFFKKDGINKKDIDKDSESIIYNTLCYWNNCLTKFDIVDAVKNYNLNKKTSTTIKGREISIELDKNLINIYLEKVNTFGITPFHLFFTVYSKSLYGLFGYSNQIIGFTSAFRPDEYFDSLGCYATVLPCFIEIKENMTNYNLLKNVSKTIWNNLEYGRIPFEIILDHFRENKKIDNFHGFEFVISYDDVATDFLNLPNIEKKYYRAFNGTSKFPLSLNIEATDKKFILYFEYQLDLFLDETINKFIELFNYELSLFLKNKI
ncbi:amino acid adenylation domain-containing protein [Acinetobacter calcoaceticus]|uniref:non-ribosomal peptide synthetase n=1 Tax=Acinetobacter calcoaceticus TaxID=471 RepID=UPI0032B328BB